MRRRHDPKPHRYPRNGNIARDETKRERPDARRFAISRSTRASVRSPTPNPRVASHPLASAIS